MKTLDLSLPEQLQHTVLTSIDLPRIIIDQVIFHTKDAQWGARLAASGLEVQCRALDTHGNEMAYRRALMPWGGLYTPEFVTPIFRIPGGWSFAAAYNPQVREEQHQKWLVHLRPYGVVLADGECVDLRLRTNMDRAQDAVFTL